VLLLGDPGLGKSELLRALARLSHRGWEGPVLLDVNRINNTPLLIWGASFRKKEVIDQDLIIFVTILGVISLFNSRYRGI
jgi:energy-coupling factor transporter ATP-binding protein EcfA2